MRNGPRPKLPKLLYSLEKSYFDGLDKHLHNDNYVKVLMGLPEDELTELLDYLSDTVNRFIRVGLPPGKCLHVLRKISSTRGVLPSSCEVSGTLTPLAGSPVAYGGFCDVQRGSLSTRRTDDVCIKKLRMHNESNPEKIKKLFCRETIAWRHLNHPSIVPFAGVTLEPLQLVSEWMPGGELRRYIQKNPGANLIHLLLNVAEGLAYLHLCGVIHGDLKGPNIVVDEFGHARITDFGLSSIKRDPNSVLTNSDNNGHTLQWTAPEILRHGVPASTKSDVFSFAMVIYEVFSGKVPFHEIAYPAVTAAILRGERPSRPNHPSFNDALWNLTQKCWDDAANDRPEMNNVIKELKGMKWVPPPPREEPSVTTAGPSVPVTTYLSVNKSEGIAPYDADALPPAPPPPQKVEKRPPAWKVNQGIEEGSNNDSSLKPPNVGDKGTLATGPRAWTEGKPEHKPPEKEKEDKERERLVHGKRLKVPKPEEGAKEAEVNTKKSRVASEERLPGFPGSTSTVYVRTEVSPNSTGQGPSPPRDDHKGVFSGPGSASYIGISKPPPPENTDSGRTIAPPDKTPDYQQTPRGRDEIVLSPERKRKSRFWFSCVCDCNHEA